MLISTLICNSIFISQLWRTKPLPKLMFFVFSALSGTEWWDYFEGVGDCRGGVVTTSTRQHLVAATPALASKLGLIIGWDWSFCQVSIHHGFIIKASNFEGFYYKISVLSKQHVWQVSRCNIRRNFRSLRFGVGMGRPIKQHLLRIITAYIALWMAPLFRSEAMKRMSFFLVRWFGFYRNWDVESYHLPNLPNDVFPTVWHDHETGGGGEEGFGRAEIRYISQMLGGECCDISWWSLILGQFHASCFMFLYICRHSSQ